jgi:small conductance mechanosensitive channel
VEHGGVRGTKRVQEEFKQRVDTLSGFLSQIAAAAIWLMAAFMALSEMGINVAPLLAGAGIVGLAIGFGAQTLVQDIISGLFIIIENQYHKGDWIMIAGISGSVEEVNLRRTVLRDLDGTIHVVPNGEVRAASNYTREYGRVNLDISVGYGEDLDRVIDVINRVGREMAAEEYWGKAVMEPPHVLRVNNLGDSGIDIKVYGKTKRVRQWEVMGELRKRIKTTFDEEGIEIPWPHTKVFFGNALEQGAGVEKKPSPPKAPAREVEKPGPSARVSRKKARERTIPTSEDETEAEGDGG